VKVTSPPSSAGIRETVTLRESEDSRITRNLHELLQELRVTQTGVQILTGFLLTLPFSSRFAQLSATQRHVYLAILAGSVVSTGLIVAPVAFHRVLFRRGQRPWIVTHANRAAKGGLLALALTTSGAVWLVFDIVTGAMSASIAGGLALLFFLSVWVVYPLAAHGGEPSAYFIENASRPHGTSTR
jgi:hypothetical protein